MLSIFLKGEGIKIENNRQGSTKHLLYKSSPLRILSHLIHLHLDKLKIGKMKELNRRAETWCKIHFINEV